MITTDPTAPDTDTDTDTQYVVTRVVDASPQEVFALLADPARHHETEPTDWCADQDTNTQDTKEQA